MRSIDELIATALVGDEDDERAWEAIRELQQRGDDAVFEAAVRLTRSTVSKERGRGVDILAQLGTPKPSAELRAKCANVILECIVLEQTPAVLNSIGFALGHLHDPRAVDALVPLATHADSEVRFGVVMGLLWHLAPTAIAALIELSADVDDDVRNWATFGLGQMNADSPALRDALVARLSDENFEIRGEALSGLAERKDARVLEPLHRELAGPPLGLFAIEAAAALGDRSILPVLEELRQSRADAPPRFLAALDAAIASLSSR